MNRNIYRSGTYYKSQLFNLMFTYLFSFKRIRNGLILAYLPFLLCSSTNSERLIVVLLCSLSTILYILKQNSKKKAVLIRLKNFSELTFDNFFFYFIGSYSMILALDSIYLMSQTFIIQQNIFVFFMTYCCINIFICNLCFLMCTAMIY